ncbi:MAG TPA: Ig-like domain-containing protein [Gemmatimonadota bacterium]|nr:Ig-like domain-containing protein [Gemmatimonadota bacterium]
MTIRTWSGIAAIALVGTVLWGCSDDVAGPPVGTVILQVEDDTLSVNATTQLHVIILSVDGDTLRDEIVTFTSGDQDIITVNSDGLVTAEGAGTATVTAQAENNVDSVSIYVRRTESIVLEQGLVVAVDDTSRLSATALDIDNEPVTGAHIFFTSSDETIAIVEAVGGLVFGVSKGTAVITAETEGLIAQAQVTVVQTVGSVALSPDSLTIAVGDTSRLTVVVRDTLGVEIAGPRVRFFCECDISDQFIASVDSLGLVTGGPNPGDFARVIARSEGIADTTYLLVTP